MFKYLAFKEATNSNCNVKDLAFKGAPSSNCNVKVPCFQSGQQQQL